MYEGNSQGLTTPIARWRVTAVIAATILLAALPLQAQSIPVSPAKITVSLSQPLTIRWRYLSSETLNLTPAADNDRIYLPLAGGTIVSLNVGDGHLYWKSDIGGELSASPAADSDAVYVASETTAAEGEKRQPTGALRALGREAGVTVWLRTLPFPIQGSLAVSDTTVFAGTSNGGFYSIDKINGDVKWFAQIGSPLNGTPALSKNAVYVGSEDGTVMALDASTGVQKWRFKTNGRVRGPMALIDDSVYFGSGDGYVYAVNEADGRLRWRSRTGAGVQAVKGVAPGLLVASFDNFVYLLNFQKGKRLWKRQLPGRISAEPVTAGDGALFTPLSGNAGVVLGLRDGKQVNVLPTGEGFNTAASPLIVNDAVFLTTDQGLLVFAQPGKLESTSVREVQRQVRSP